MFPALLETAQGAAQGFTLTSEMFDGLVTSITNNAAVIVPVGVAAMGVLVSIRIVPRVVKYFI